MAKPTNRGEWALNTSIVIVVFVVWRFYPAIAFAAFVIFLFILLLVFVPLILAALYVKKVKGKISKRVLSILSWSNVITWVIPLLGIFTSIATWRINVENKDTDHAKYARLALIGIILSIVNVLVTAIFKLTHVI